MQSVSPRPCGFSASADVDEAVTTAITTAATDVGNAIFIVLVTAAAIRYLRHVL